MNNFTKRKMNIGWNGGKTGPTCPNLPTVRCEFDDFELIGYGTETVALAILPDNKNAEVEVKENAKLICSAFNGATKLAEMGYDAQKVIEYLPDIVESIENVLRISDRDHHSWNSLKSYLVKVKP
jgi:hypothetical protein